MLVWERVHPEPKAAARNFRCGDRWALGTATHATDQALSWVMASRKVLEEVGFEVEGLDAKVQVGLGDLGLWVCFRVWCFWVWDFSSRISASFTTVQGLLLEGNSSLWLQEYFS